MQASPTNESGRLFSSPVLEALTRTHIAFPLVIFYGTSVLSMVLVLGAYGIALKAALGLFFVGLVFFTLVEYTVHRYFYHMSTADPGRARIQYMFHGVHHEFPRDKKRLALPPAMSIVVASAFMGLFWLLLGVAGFAFGSGFLTGYATYLMIHYAIHVHPPPKNFLGAVWKHHNLHHFVGDTAAFGVSSPLWDHIFGTMPPDPLERRAGRAKA